jgi:hypothetical protein
MYTYREAKRRSSGAPQEKCEPVPPVLRIAALIWAILAGAIAIGCVLVGAWPAGLAEIGIVIFLTKAFQRSTATQNDRA